MGGGRCAARIYIRVYVCALVPVRECMCVCMCVRRSCTLSLPLEDAEPLLKDGAVERLHWDDVGRYA